MKLGLLGGSFNPPHNGHLAMARAARTARSLDEVWFVTAARPPHKDQNALCDFPARFDMTSLAANEEGYVKACDIEAQLPGTSYTYRTLEVLKEKHAAAELFFVLGADTVPELRTWKNPQRIFELAQPVTIPRTGYAPKDTEKLRGILPEEQIEAIRDSYLSVHPVDISSTMIREMISRGEGFEKLVPKTVAWYILKHKLYS